jgi:hypothetical protein
MPTAGASLGLLSLYGVSAARSYRSTRARGRAREDAAAYALFNTLGKLPELQGLLEFELARWRGGRRDPIEYK